jgi:2-phospho-L-lactate guanylyltransferase
VTRWTLLVPLKVLPGAKSRLADSLSAQLTSGQHAELVAAIRTDTLAAAGMVGQIARIVVIADQPSPDADLVQREPGLNAALREAAEHAAQHWPTDGIAALVGDLPALRPEELGAALGSGHDRAFVPDASGTGTTLLAVRPGRPLEPRFGPDSAARHASDAVALDGGPGLRCDVDTVDDLRAAIEVGLGSATREVLARYGSFI